MLKPVVLFILFFNLLPWSLLAQVNKTPVGLSCGLSSPRSSNASAILDKVCLQSKKDANCDEYEKAHPEWTESFNDCAAMDGSEIVIECSVNGATAAAITTVTTAIGWEALVLVGGAYAGYRMAINPAGLFAEDQKCFYDLQGKKDRIEKFNSGLADEKFKIRIAETHLKNMPCLELRNLIQAKWKSYLVNNQSRPEIYLSKKVDNGLNHQGLIDFLGDKYNHSACFSAEVKAGLACSALGSVVGLGPGAIANKALRGKIEKILANSPNSLESSAAVNALLLKQALAKSNAEFQKELAQRLALAKTEVGKGQVRAGSHISSFEDYQNYLPADKSRVRFVEPVGEKSKVILEFEKEGELQRIVIDSKGDYWRRAAVVTENGETKLRYLKADGTHHPSESAVAYSKENGKMGEKPKHPDLKDNPRVVELEEKMSELSAKMKLESDRVARGKLKVEFKKYNDEHQQLNTEFLKERTRLNSEAAKAYKEFERETHFAVP